MSSTLVALRERIDTHVQRYARALGWDLRGGRLEMSDCWANVMRRGCAHSLHLHPQAVISGTYYVKTPARASGLRVEDPRLSRFMASPQRRGGTHIVHPARAGHVILFESWLRHEVPASAIAAERVSLSFNYHWV